MWKYSGGQKEIDIPQYYDQARTYLNKKIGVPWGGKLLGKDYDQWILCMEVYRRDS